MSESRAILTGTVSTGSCLSQKDQNTEVQRKIQRKLKRDKEEEYLREDTNEVQMTGGHRIED